MMPQGPPSTTSGSDASDSSWIDVVSRQPQAADLDQLSVATVCTLPSSQAPGNPPPVTGVTGGDPREIMWELLDLPATGGYMMGSPIRLGSICTNLMTEKWACERLPWTFEKVFWCEKDKFARKFIQDNVEPGVPDFHCCQTDEFLTNAPPCDLLLGGFIACQPFSIMGRGDGDVIPSSRHLSSRVQSEAPGGGEAPTKMPSRMPTGERSRGGGGGGFVRSAAQRF